MSDRVGFDDAAAAMTGVDARTAKLCYHAVLQDHRTAPSCASPPRWTARLAPAPVPRPAPIPRLIRPAAATDASVTPKVSSRSSGPVPPARVADKSSTPPAHPARAPGG